MSMVVLRHLGHAHCVLLRHLVMPTALSFVIKKKLHCHLGMSTGLLVSHVQLQSTMYEHCRLIYSNLVSLIILALTIPAHSQFSVKKLTYIMWGVNSCFNSSIAFF